MQSRPADVQKRPTDTSVLRPHVYICALCALKIVGVTVIHCFVFFAASGHDGVTTGSGAAGETVLCCGWILAHHCCLRQHALYR